MPEAKASGTAPSAEPALPPVVDWNDGTWDRAALTRAASRDFPAWLHHVRPAAGCAHPIRLAGTSMTVEAGTGRLVSSFSTADLPDGVLYKPCGNRRETWCPSCSARYKRDAYQIVRAGLVGGKGVPESVATHPAVFATFTAPSFGPVHTRHVKHHRCQDRKRCVCRPEPCHARRDAAVCPHGTLMACYARHAESDRVLGSGLCLDCYDYNSHVVWNLQAGELWRRTTIAINRHLRRVAKERGQLIPTAGPNDTVRWVSPVRLSPGKAAEMQRRAAVHFHAIIRLDGYDPYNPDAMLPPPAGFTAAELVDAVNHAAATVGFTTTDHPVRPGGWPIAWGDRQGIDVRVITMSGTGQVTDAMVANYLAKYATKSTEATGAVFRRLTEETVHLHADPDGTHTERLTEACWILGQPRPWRGLRRWAHMFGFGGHFFTKGRHYSVTFSLLRDQRIVYRRTETAVPTDAAGPSAAVEAPTTLVVNLLEFIGAGWLTTADARLATTSAALAREHQSAARAELASLTT